MPVTIAVDAAGREPGSAIIVEGVKLALREAAEEGQTLIPVLYGPPKQVRAALDEAGLAEASVRIQDAPDVIEMTEEPAEALRSKTNSSILRGIHDLRDHAVDAFVSMGNTGAVVGASRAFIGSLRWIGKPALGVPIPTVSGKRTLLLDVGASPDPKPGHLLQFATMGSVFAELMYQVNEPRVGLLNIGVESYKGDERARDAHKLLARSPLNFVGNVEGGDIVQDRADVVVTTGFVGNILLKFTESLPLLLSSGRCPDGSLPDGQEALKRLDYRQYGGASLLGVNGNVVIGHGRSNPEAVARALRWARHMVDRDLPGVLRDRVFKIRRALWLSNPFSRGEGSDDS